MAEFSIQDAAFTGFRVVREHPRALGVWALYALVLSLAFAAILVGLLGADFAQLMALNSQPPKDPAATLALIKRVAPAYLLFVAVGVGFKAVLNAGMIRAVLQPSADRFGFLRLGADEVRQLGLTLLTMLLFLGVSLALMTGIVTVGYLLALVSKLIGGAAFVLGLFGMVAALAYLAVRFSLAPALTFDSRRVNLFGSWTLTRGRFWPLFGVYFLTLALVLMVYVLSGMVIAAVQAVMDGGNLGAPLAKPDLTSLGAYFTPFRLIQTVLMAGVSALVWPVMMTPPATVYRSLAVSSAAAFA